MNEVGDWIQRAHWSWWDMKTWKEKKGLAKLRIELWGSSSTKLNEISVKSDEIETQKISIFESAIIGLGVIIWCDSSTIAQVFLLIRRHNYCFDFSTMCVFWRESRMNGWRWRLNTIGGSTNIRLLSGVCVSLSHCFGGRVRGAHLCMCAFLAGNCLFY